MRILLAAPVRQAPDVFKLYLESLDNLDTTGIELDRFFILHNSPDLQPLIPERDGCMIHTTDEPDVRADDTHHWGGSNMAQVTAMKNWLIKYAVDHKYDAIFFVDSDLVLHPKTLQALVRCEKEIVAEIFWTAWQPGADPTPNAWMWNAYELAEDSLETWRKPGLYPVGMSGACILIRREVLEKGIDYRPVHNVHIWGEDRHFCIRAAAHDYVVWLDTRCPAMHLYRSADVEAYSRTRKLVGAMLVRNETGRWLAEVLEQMTSICDEVVVLDDGSEDQTASVCGGFGATVKRQEKSTWETDETPLRQRLWTMATKAAGDGGWILCLDADETFEPDALSQIRRLLPLAEYNRADAIGFRLHDMWSEDHYRDDELWTAHRRLWPMLVRYDARRQYEWSGKALHGGRFPLNAATSVYNSGYRIQHWGWSRPEDRQRKYERYMRLDGDGKHGIVAQYESILDESPSLVRWEP